MRQKRAASQLGWNTEGEPTAYTLLGLLAAALFAWIMLWLPGCSIGTAITPGWHDTYPDENCIWLPAAGGGMRVCENTPTPTGTITPELTPTPTGTAVRQSRRRKAKARSIVRAELGPSPVATHRIWTRSYTTWCGPSCLSIVEETIESAPIEAWNPVPPTPGFGEYQDPRTPPVVAVVCVPVGTATAAAEAGNPLVVPAP